MWVWYITHGAGVLCQKKMWIAVKQQYQFDVSITSRGAGVLGKKRFELQFKKWYQFEARVASHGAGMLCKKDLNSSLKNNTSLQLKTSQKKKKKCCWIPSVVGCLLKGIMLLDPIFFFWKVFRWFLSIINRTSSPLCSQVIRMDSSLSRTDFFFFLSTNCGSKFGR